MNNKFTIFFLSLTFFCRITHAQLLAFPTAEGAGKNTSGGRGSVATAPAVYEVTNLGDVNAAGSLRYAATVSGPSSRIIVFRVAGTIHLSSALSFNKANTTIAGQTSPGEGICLADYPVSINANNIIVRYIRFRMGDKNQNPSGGFVVGSGNDDSFDDASHNHNHLIIDHCTMSWSDDEACTFYGGDSLTLQWNILSEPLNYSYHLESGDADYEHHGYGGIWGGRHTSFHHNLLAHCQGRVPRFDGVRNLSNVVGAENADFRNNVLYNWGSYNTNGGEGGNYNIINNFYRWGPSTPTGSSSGVRIRSMIINPYKQTSPALPYGIYYLEGNFVDSLPGIPSLSTNNNWRGAAMNSGSYADTTSAKALVPFTMTPVNTNTAADAYNLVLQNAGVTLPNRDTLDARVVNNVINRTGNIIDVQGNYPHGTPYASTVNAWPTLAAGFAPADNDHDGMPDVWEDQRGLNKNSNTDLNGYTSTTGYSNIETYLNGDTIVAPGTLNNCVSAKAITSNNSGVWVNAKDTIYGYYNSPSYLISTDTNNIVASVLDNGNFGTFNASYYTTNTLRYDPLITKPILNRNVTITPLNPALITSPVTVRIYFSVAEFNNLKAADPSVSTIADLVILKSADNVCTTILPSVYSIISPNAFGIFDSYQNGYYLQFQTSSFSTFFVGSKTSFPLPLKLISFNAALINKKVETKWITQNEINTKGFEVERSSDGVNFNKTGNVTANNNAGINNYFFTDANPLPGISYYRLKMIDIDGKISYSNTIPVNNIILKSLSVSPDPASSEIKIFYPASASVASLQITGIDGKKLVSRKLNASTSEVIINISSLPKGVYEIIYNNNKQTQTIKFLKN